MRIRISYLKFDECQWKVVVHPRRGVKILILWYNSYDDYNDTVIVIARLWKHDFLGDKQLPDVERNCETEIGVLDGVVRFEDLFALKTNKCKLIQKIVEGNEEKKYQSSRSRLPASKLQPWF